MSYSNNNCSCAGFDLVGLSSSLAFFISKNFDSDDLGILGAFFTTLGDNISLIASSRAICESKISNNSTLSSIDLSTKSTDNFYNKF